MFQNKPRYLDELNRTMLITALVLTIIMNVINVIGVSSYLQSMAVGIVIILMVWLDVFTRSKREKLSRA